ncbi:unnamed protein product [Parnassius apollo]|uniref:(apollo) hypothetical protein n=1 Tax=Parnassius apollo TaxID=110799 RepID=A0A8S3WCN4_PARAO|nr:unnamed protein product [Parnassius apollo]
MSGKEGNLNERDIEDYLSKLEGGWLSEDGLDDQDSDDENRDADEVIRVMQEENKMMTWMKLLTLILLL